MRFGFIAFVLFLVLSGCSTLSQRNPVPLLLIDDAHIAGIGDVRMWGDVKPDNIDRLVAEKVRQIMKARPALSRSGKPLQLNFLALSGGADDGAFGAGLIAGWSKTGKRPRFDIVTGVSTGALMAPFVFLGSAYDRKLREIYTTYSTDDFLVKKPLAGLLGGSSLADPKPLVDLIARYIDETLLAAIAREHNKGRSLFVMTTNLDAQRPVLWDMGKIASSGHRGSLALFRQVMVASVSIPGAFPPTHIKVTAGGKHYDEMHVDGGTMSEVFLLPTQLMSSAINNRPLARSQRRLFIVMNNKILPDWKPVEASLLPVSQRSLATLIKSQSIADLTRLYHSAKRNGTDYNLAAIPDSFDMEKRELFDRDYMKALFNLGFDLGKKGYQWAKHPPGLPDGVVR